MGRYLNQHLSLINSPNFNSMSFDINSPAVTTNYHHHHHQSYGDDD